MRDSLMDLRYAWRALRRAPVFTAVAVAILGLGIGANTAIFSVAHAVLLRPLSFPNADRLVVAWEWNIPRARERNVVASVNYLAWRDAASDIGELAALGQVAGTLTGGREAERLGGAAITPNLLHVLGLSPVIGRAFTEQEGAPGSEPVIILSNPLWHRRFRGDTAVLGRTVTLNGDAYTVVGVMGAGVSLPAIGPFGDESFLLPLALDPAAQYQGRSLFVLGRLAPKVTVDGAQERLRAVAARLAEQHDYDEGWSANVVPLFDEVVGEARSLILLLLGSVGLVLVVACVNVAAMVLVRGSSRERELALRRTLGAKRSHLIRQLLAEGLVLATLGALVGLVIGVWGRSGLVALAPEGVPRLDYVPVSPPVLVFAACMTLGCGVVLGLVPLLRGRDLDLEAVVRGGRGATERAGHRVRHALVVVEVALAVVLCIAAGLTVKSFTKLTSVDPGFRAEGVLTARLALSGDAYEEDPAIAAFYISLLERLRASPGVTHAAATARLPLDGLWVGTSFALRDRAEPPRSERPVADIRVVTPGYFETLAIPLRAGRDFSAADREQATRVAVINETMARTYWPEGSPIGREVAVNIADPTYVATIVGVVRDVKHQGFDTSPRAMIYLAHEQLPVGTMSVALRTNGDPAALAGVLRAAVEQSDPLIPVYAVAPMTDLVAQSMAADRFGTSLFVAFAVLALTLAAVGTYGVVAYGVSRRARELGIRMALGAMRPSVLSLVMADGMRPVVAGVALGLLAALPLAQLLRAVLFEVRPADPMAFAAAALALLSAAVVACLVPALRATLIEPVEVLRHE